ncbi:hypothetical protein F1559_003153 [Cyanidiococcus yangmingshanensis]|uniref:DDHD domain-containing protein n=1 Tax=Cyanidiococcus yangmingshanensis TaxID=2690220 RepID=A0A7J7IEM9_9RHOD|nr:hypothetical protein F1559_003153 [Cyanidiococcus yangmingshanensis]
MQPQEAASSSLDAEDYHLVLVVHGVGDQYADNNFVTSLERCTEALARRVERQWRLVRDQLLSTQRKLGLVTDLRIHWPRIELRCIEWHSKLQYKHGWNHMVERVTPAGIEEVRRVMRETFGDIALFMSPKWHQIIMEEVVHELTVQYERVRAQLLTPSSSRGTPPTIHVALLCHSLGALIGFDLIRLGYNLPFQIEHVFLCGSPLGAYLSLLPDGEKLAHEYLLDLCSDRSAVASFAPGEAHLYGSSVTRETPLTWTDASSLSSGTTCSSQMVSATTTSMGRLGARPRFYNLFHPLDPAAFRLEPWLDASMVLQESVELPLALEYERVLERDRIRSPSSTMPTRGTTASMPLMSAQSKRLMASEVDDRQRACPGLSLAPCNDNAPAHGHRQARSGEVVRVALLSSPRLAQLGGDGNPRDDPFATTGLGAALRGKAAIGLSRSSSNPEFTVPLLDAVFDPLVAEHMSGGATDPVAEASADWDAHSLGPKRPRHAFQPVAAHWNQSLGSYPRPEEYNAYSQWRSNANSGARIENEKHQVLAGRTTTPVLYFRRIDYVVHDPQVARSGRVWQFVQCLRSHACYWTSDEVASFVVGILCNCLQQPCARFTEPVGSTDTDLGSMAIAQRGGNESTMNSPVVSHPIDVRVSAMSDSISASEPLVADSSSSAETQMILGQGSVSARRCRAHTPELHSAGVVASANPVRAVPGSDGTDDSLPYSDNHRLWRKGNCVQMRCRDRHPSERMSTGISRERRGSPSIDAARKDHQGHFRFLHEVSSMSPAPTVGLLVGDSAPRPLRIFSDLLERLVTEGRWIAALLLVSGAFIATCGLLALVLLLALRSLYMTLLYQHQRLSPLNDS